MGDPLKSSISFDNITYSKIAFGLLNLYLQI